MQRSQTRFARDLIVQETGHRMLKAQGIEIIAADSPGAFVEDTPTATLRGRPFHHKSVRAMPG